MSNNSSPWLPVAFNQGHAYRDRVDRPASSITGFYAERYRHSDQTVWMERLTAGEIWCNGQQLRADAPLVAGDRLVWHRPPWQEAAVPVLSERSIVFDDGDLLVLNKPSGLPVLPAGGFLEHTLLRQMQAWAPEARPVHRLGRFTSGLLVCARRPSTRAWLSAQLRESTSAAADSAAPQACRKLYRALCQPLPADWALGETRVISAAIGRSPHPLLGQICCAAQPGDSAALPSRSELTLLEHRAEAALVEVAIATGRPHQIRIHTAAIGAPLLGDPLYRAGGLADPAVLPGAGGYQLHAHRLSLVLPAGVPLQLEAPLPSALRSANINAAPPSLMARQSEQLKGFGRSVAAPASTGVWEIDIRPMAAWVDGESARDPGYRPSLLIVVEARSGLVRAMQPERPEDALAALPAVLSQAAEARPAGCRRGRPSRVVVGDAALLKPLAALLPGVAVRQGSTPQLDQAFGILSESVLGADLDALHRVPVDDAVAPVSMGAFTGPSRALVSAQNPLQLRVGALLQSLDALCSAHLNPAYQALFHSAVAALARQQPSPLLKGRESSWCAGLAHAIGVANFLFVSSQTPHCTIKELFSFFGVSSSVGYAHSKKVRDLLGIESFAPAWTLASLQEPSAEPLMVRINGMMIDASKLPADVKMRVCAQLLSLGARSTPG